jgi:hypothetical protein
MALKFSWKTLLVKTLDVWVSNPTTRENLGPLKTILEGESYTDKKALTIIPISRKTNRHCLIKNFHCPIKTTIFIL